MVNRLLYLGYYLRNLNTKVFKKFLNFAKEASGRGKSALIWEMLQDSLTYKISLLEYFQFEFYQLRSRTEKDKWAGTGFMYEYQKQMNPPQFRDILDSKVKFHKAYHRYFRHQVFSRADLQADSSRFDLLAKYPQLVLKEAHGKCGLGTHFYLTKDLTVHSLLAKMQQEGFDIAESWIEQHPEMNRLSPSGVNTVRIITQLNHKDTVDVLACRQRISVNSSIDNLASGNLAAAIDASTGLIEGPAVYSDITKPEETYHPVTKTEIVGFQIPYWQECLEMAKAAALEHPQNRSVGWDIAVTDEGPTLIEGNHDWCKLVWQLPVKQGMKATLLSYL